MAKSDQEYIKLFNVRQNNLKGFDLELPLGKLIVVTGLSGTGKSSLVFDTLHAEGQRRYIETFSPYVRQFLETLDRPAVDSIENIRPSIAIEQTNTVKTSRSTVGTMTELTDFFKVWFCKVAGLFDPETGEKIEDDNPQSIWRKASAAWPKGDVLLSFRIVKPDNLSWEEILEPVKAQGYVRCIVNHEIIRLEDLKEKDLKGNLLMVVQDRTTLVKENERRFMEAASTAIHYGDGELFIHTIKGEELGHFSEGLHSPKTGRRFRAPTPALFSFNSPIGACDKCRGFGKTVEMDYNLIIPDKSLSIKEGAIKCFHGEVMSKCLEELKHAAGKKGIKLSIPWSEMPEEDIRYVIDGDPHYGERGTAKQNLWYGIKGFFDWVESKKYKQHMRFILAKYRSYVTCDKCHGKRLRPQALCWKWQGYTLPDLYDLSIRSLNALLRKQHKQTGNHPVDLAANAILSRLNYLEQVGLGYLTLSRQSRTLSGGEVERVNLTTCLGTSLVETLFVLDEPSVGLHARDIDRLVRILRQLTDLGNTVVVVEHDEAVMRAADHIIEMGPEPGSKGGEVVFSGTVKQILASKQSLTGAYLNGKKDIDLPLHRRPWAPGEPDNYAVHFDEAHKHNIENLSFSLPLERFVCVCGVSGSGKSTLVNNIIYKSLMEQQGASDEEAANVKELTSDLSIGEIVLVDQSPISKTPRSNPALYCEAWDHIRELFATSQAAYRADLTASHFSFNAGQGRCDHCQGLGYQKEDMQFLSDVYVQCPVCEGKRFKPEVLEVTWNWKSIADVLNMDVDEAIRFFANKTKIINRLKTLKAVGLGYLTLGQPLNTLSGGESQRLKLVKYLSRFSEIEDTKLFLLDEPTTGLHRDDVRKLLDVLQQLVSQGNSLVVIEHQMDVIKSADWIIEMGPDAGDQGGKIVAEGTPEEIATKNTATARFLREVLPKSKSKGGKADVIEFKYEEQPEELYLTAAEPEVQYFAHPQRELEIIGAREHNLKNISLKIPHRALTVLTGVSGSGKSSLAFDIIFAEGQRRFMESISAYARQFIEQMPKPDIDKLTGIPPTVAIEQRVTRGSRKSTVATITEVAQYLRLLYAKIGIQHSLHSGAPVIALSNDEIFDLFERYIKLPSKRDAKHLYLCAPLVKSRKGHHQPLATWAQNQGYQLMYIDKKWVNVNHFEKLDRYKEHDIDIVVVDLGKAGGKLTKVKRRELLDMALQLGRGSCFLRNLDGTVLTGYSNQRTDPVTGESYPELDPKHFSWNSPKGWCEKCNGQGYLYEERKGPGRSKAKEISELCPDCHGDRLNPTSCAVKIYVKGDKSGTEGEKALSLPDILRMPPGEVIETVQNMSLDKRGQQIVRDIIPQIRERLRFMDQVGLNYLTLNRSSATLSGGEAQRIRLAAQLSSNLSGVLYVLDEPSIGLHARDNQRLIDSLKVLRDKGNTLLVVEHDDEMMRQADHIIDLGPGAGVHGGHLLAHATIKEIVKNKNSITGQYLKKGISHPTRGSYRKLPAKWNPKKKANDEADPDWMVLKKCHLRNLKGQDLHIPLGKLTVVCGISGAGKSTLVRDLLKPCVAYAIEQKLQTVTGEDLVKKDYFPKDGTELPFAELLNANVFKNVVEVDQEPIGKTPRSTPATYIGAFDIIRDYFTSLPEAKMHGYDASVFSFNTEKGRCETCGGAGRIKLEMNFLPDTYVTCEDCNGTRYSPELREVRWKGKNISDILNLSFEEAVPFFEFHSRLKAILQLMIDTGLGYLTLGQSSPSLSGGEAQRLKLVSELAKGLPTFKERTRGISPKNLYILEEPTIGLHLSDCERLIHLLHDLVDQGHTVVVIEHHLDIIAEADYVVEVGPEGGDAGGTILYQGVLAGLKKCKESQTAKYLP